MVVFGVRRHLPWVRLTQVGDPLSHGEKGLIHCVSADRVTGLAGLTVSEAEDQEVAKARLVVGQRTEGRMLSVVGAEGRPELEDLVGGSLSLGSGASVGNLERSSEIRCKLTAAGRWSSCQPLGCGYSCSKWEWKAVGVRCCRQEASSAMTLSGPGRYCTWWQ